MRRAILFFLVALCATPAWARGNHHAPKEKGAPDAAPAADSAPAKKDLEKLCANKENPFKDLTPFAPSNAREAGVEDGKPMTDEAEAKLRFDDRLCGKSRADANAEVKVGCDKAYARIYRSVRDGNFALKEALGGVCDKIKGIEAQCKGQTDAEKCSRNVYKDVGNDLKATVDRLGSMAKSIHDFQDWHVQRAKADQAQLLSPSAAPTVRDPKAPPKFVAAASSRSTVTRPTETILRECPVRVQATAFCDHAAAAADSGYFAGKLEIEIKGGGDLAKKFQQLGTVSGERNDNGGGVNDGKGEKKDGKSGLLGGMGLDDMLKVATLGMTGATLYCSLTKKCGSQSDPTQSGISDASTQPAAAAAPAGPETSSTGGTADGASSPLASATGTSTATETSLPAASGYGSYGGGSSDPLLSHFNGNLDSRGPASVPATGGAVGGGGASAGLGEPSDRTGASAPYDGAAKAPTDAGGIGSFPGGGGLASSGTGFNLGSGSAATPADAALKSILNGDTPPGTDAQLSPLDTDGGTQASPDADDAETLFSRVRETHVRCLKRGCVGQEVGDNI
jgi:hypothetical protein